MTNTTSSENQDVLNRVCRDLSGLKILGSDVYLLIRIPLYFAIKNTRSSAHSKRYIFFFRQLMTLAKLLGTRTISWLFAKRVSNITGETLVVIDHSPSKDVEFQSLILKHFSKDNIQILTISRLVPAQLEPSCTDRIYRSDCMASRVRLDYRDYIFGLKVLFHTKRIGDLSLPYLAVWIIRTISYIRLYEQVLSSAKTKAVVTLCDAHPHEHALTVVASRKGIFAYTNQHGMIGSLYAPVISHKIFVWGDVSKNELLRLGVDQKKIVVVGRVGLTAVPVEANTRQLSTVSPLSKKYKFDPSRLIISYFATNYGEHENVELFRAFCSILSLPVNILVRLRPGASDQQIAQYRKWFLNYSKDSIAHVVISNEDSMQEVFEGIDVVVTCHSGCIVDAMPYSVAGIILDIFEHMNLRNSLPHYQDAIVCHDAASFCSKIQSVVEDHDLLIPSKQRAFKSYRRYFANPNGKPVDQVIADYIIHNLSLDNLNSIP